MNLAAAIAIASASIALAVAIHSARLGRLPGWASYRWLAVIAAGSATYALGNLATTTGQPDAVVLAASRFQLAGLLLELWGWYRFADVDIGEQPPRWEAWLRRAILVVAALCLVPGFAYGGAVTGHAFAPWGVRYRDAVPTTAGAAVFAAGLVAAGWLVVKFLRAARRGGRDALLHGLALAVLAALGINDALAATGLADLPYLLDVGFLVPLAALFWSQGERRIREAEQLRDLRDQLGRTVAERTEQLAATQRSLHQAERLAALGQFAAGVAHRINNPAAVVQSTLNLHHEALAAGRRPEESIESVLEAREAMRRITGLVRQLTDAGRIAASPPPREGCDVARVLEQEVAAARLRHPAGVSFFVAAPPGIRALMAEAELGRVVAALLSNGALAARRGQALLVVAGAKPVPGGKVEISVADDGVGMAPEILGRVFDPFFTTRPEGEGAGLGLTVARSLVEVAGGTIELESEPGAGTNARVRLSAAGAPPTPA